MDESYGIDVLIRAFRLLTERHPDAPCKLVLVGGGTRENEYKRLAQRLGLGARVDFAGRVPHERVPEYLRSFSVFAALSRRESFGVAVLEASACGIPVVVTNVGGLPEVVADGQTALMVSPDDEIEAAGCFERLLLSPSLRNSLGQAGQRWVRRRFEWNRTARVMETLYDEVISKSSRSEEHEKSSIEAAV
jgi:glycosyltransferase involved in cell wall biosynthesis